MKLQAWVGCLLLGSALVSLLLPGRIFAQPALTVPATMQVNQPGLVIIRATTSCPWVVWDCADGGFQIIPSDLLKNSLACVAFASSTGTYRVTAIAGDATGPAPKGVCMVTVGQPSPPPPSDPLTASLQAAYSAEPSLSKILYKDKLQALYALTSTKTVNDTTFATVVELIAKIKTARANLMQPTDLAGVQAIIDQDLAKWPGTQALDAATRQAIAAELGHVANALGQVNGTGKR